MAQDNKSETIIIRVDSDLKHQLQRMADGESRSLSNYIRLQLEKLVETSKKKK